MAPPPERKSRTVTPVDGGWQRGSPLGGEPPLGVVGRGPQGDRPRWSSHQAAREARSDFAEGAGGRPGTLGLPEPVKAVRARPRKTKAAFTDADA